MFSERRQVDIKILRETLSDVGEIAAVEPLSSSDNRNYRIRFHGRTQDIFAKVADNRGDPENPLTIHQMGLQREFSGLMAFHSVPELLEVMKIPKPLRFEKVDSPGEGGDETQMLFLPYLEELTPENTLTNIPQEIYASVDPLGSKALTLAKLSAFSHYEFIHEPHQKSLWQSSSSEIKGELDNQKTHFKRGIYKEDVLNNILDFPYLWHDISSEFDIVHNELIQNLRTELSLRSYWLTFRPLSDKSTVYYENLSENFYRGNKRVVVPGERAPWNEAIFSSETASKGLYSWQFDFEKWSEIPISRFLGQNLAALIHFQVPLITNTYTLAFMIAWGTNGLRPTPIAQIKERISEFFEILVLAAHYAAVFRIWAASSLLKVFRDVEGANKALEQAKLLLRNPFHFLEGCKEAISDPTCIQEFWEIRAQAGVRAFMEWDGRVPALLEDHANHAAKVFNR
ncbi:MAG: hypothetical protein ACXACI_10575 [Candidatus Hodarchaeales archaeon]|jgi:hypothetical protein